MQLFIASLVSRVLVKETELETAAPLTNAMSATLQAIDHAEKISS